MRAHAVTTEHVRYRFRSTIHAPRVKAIHRLRNDQVKLYPVEIRYCWPSELDLMASSPVATASPVGRLDSREFNASSQKHISVYEYKSTVRLNILKTP